MIRRFFGLAITAVLISACSAAALPSPEPLGLPSPVTTDVPSPTPSVRAPVLAPALTPAAKPSPLASGTPPTAPGTTAGVNLRVPFTPQAPYAVWDDLLNEACEEASMIMVDAYFKGKSLNAHLMEQGILSLVKWQTERGYTVDVTAAETVKILRDHFQLPARLLTSPTAAVIRSELDAGRLVIVPAAGRRLGNPYYRRPGPLYHMLVIRGYDPRRGECITNDPGTKRGDGYRYREDVLLAANHDWPKPGKTKDDVTDAEMEAGAKVVIVVEGKVKN